MPRFASWSAAIVAGFIAVTLVGAQSKPEPPIGKGAPTTVIPCSQNGEGTVLLDQFFPQSQAETYHISADIAGYGYLIGEPLPFFDARDLSFNAHLAPQPARFTHYTLDWSTEAGMQNEFRVVVYPALCSVYAGSTTVNNLQVTHTP